MIVIGDSLLDGLSGSARKSTRLRLNHNFHADYTDPVNRMLNAFEPGTYVRPHRHASPDKWEVFIILRGKAAAVRFEENGAIAAHAILDNAGGVFGTEFAPREWHTIIPLISGTVLYEIKPGPYSPADDKNFALWAPQEGSPESGAYMASLLEKLGWQMPA